MKQVLSGLILLVALRLFTGCNEDIKKESLIPNVSITNIENNFKNWYKYQYDYIDLNSDFIALDQDAKEIGKREFLEILSNGDFYAVEMNYKKEETVYKLIPVNTEKPSSAQISTRTRIMAKYALMNYDLRGAKFPDFEFSDLNGNPVSLKDLKDKLTVISFWHIDCKACNYQVSNMNSLIKDYGKDIAFLSMAYDEREDLDAFAREKSIDYDLISVPKTFITEKVGVNQFPTHMILDEDANIISVFNGDRYLSKKLDKYLEKSALAEPVNNSKKG